MKSASNGGILKDRLQVLHVHILLVASLGAGQMVQPGTGQYEGRVAVWETTHHTGATANLPIQPFNDIVGADSGPVLAGKIAVGQRFLNTILHLLTASFSFMERSSSITALAFSQAAFLLSWA